MEKINGLQAIIGLVFLIIFNAIFFIIGGVRHNVPVWIAYSFIHFAYLMLLLTPKFILIWKSLNKHSSDTEEEQVNQVDYIKKASIKLKELLEETRDNEAKNKIERAYDTLYSGPVKPNPNLVHLEKEVFMSVNELEDAILIENKDRTMLLADSLLTAINERNNYLRQDLISFAV